jgi:hypothetical protein
LSASSGASLKASAPPPIFKTSGKAEGGAGVALTTLVVAGAFSFVYTEARCPHPCNWPVMMIPGRVHVEVRRPDAGRGLSGRGRACICRRCRSTVEVIEHGG